MVEINHHNKETHIAVITRSDFYEQVLKEIDMVGIADSPELVGQLDELLTNIGALTFYKQSEFE